ncbi:MAG: dockerin type I domain-containing protein [Desulfococcaceae bacterium]
MRTWKIFMVFMLVLAGYAGPVLGADCTCDINNDGDITPLDALLLSDKIRGNCPTSLGIPCEDICSDVNADGSLNAEDADMIFDRFFGQAGKCAEIPICEKCYFKQDKAKQTLMDIASYMEKFFAEYDYYLFSMDKYGISVKNDAYYEYSIHEVENEPLSFRIIASSKSPGISGGGKGDDVWTFERINSTGQNLIHTVNGCPACPENNCFSCLWDQERARNGLSNVSKNEEAYYADSDTYSSSLSEIGYTPSVYDKYGYTIAADDKIYLATASSKAPGIMGGGAGDDVWTIDQSLSMKNTANACHECPMPSGYLCAQCVESQNEAEHILGSVAKLQEAHLTEYDIYATDFASLGITLNPNSLYEYVMEATENSFTVNATSKKPGLIGKGSGDDIWIIKEDNILIHVANACPVCPGITDDTYRSDLPMAIYSYYECRSRQSDAKQILGTISWNEKSYYIEYGNYSDSLYTMGFDPEKYFSRYQFEIVLGDGGKSYTATATSKEPGINGDGAGDDVWTIDQSLHLTNTKNACACYSSGECPMNYWPDNKGLFAKISDVTGGVTIGISLGKTPNDVASVAFDLLYDPAVLKFKTASSGLLLQNFDKFSVREIYPGRVRAGGYTTGTPIPENTDADLATLTFDILSPCSTDLKFVNLKDNMVSWQEHTLRYSSGNELAHAVALLRIAAGQNTEIPACVPDIGNDGKKGLAEAVWLLQETAKLR